MSTRLSLCLATVAWALLPVTAIGQKSTSTGLMANVHITGMSLAAEKGDTIESGGGVGARIGWGVTRNVTVFVGVDRASIETEEPGLGGSFRLTQADAGAIYNFRAGKSFLPYFEGAVTTRILESEYTDPAPPGTKVDLNTRGMAFTFGGGFNYFFTPIWAFNLGLNYSVGKFEDFEADGTRAPDTGFSASGARFHMGVTLYPMKR
jgi:opacity protein-like surface antigen